MYLNVTNFSELLVNLYLNTFQNTPKEDNTHHLNWKNYNFSDKYNIVRVEKIYFNVGTCTPSIATICTLSSDDWSSLLESRISTSFRTFRFACIVVSISLSLKLKAINYFKILVL